MKKFIAVLVGLMMVASLVGCGGSGASGSDASGSGEENVKGAAEEWGNLSIFVPEGYSLVGGDLLDEENADALTVQNDEDVFNYVIVSINEEESIDESLEWTRDFNSDCEFTDISYDLDNGSFAGFSYLSYETNCIGLKGEVGGKFVQISAAGLDNDDEILQAVIESITVK